MSEASRESGALTPALFLPGNFEFGEVPSTEGSSKPAPAAPQVPTLGPLSAFTGTWHGHGFNQIFRPDLGSPTKLPIPVRSDNLLELNLVSQTLSFTRPIGTVPNRGETTPDIFLNGVGYLLTVSDITNPAKPIGIHFEPGVWMNVPATTDPPEGNSLVRMASIPHGTTLNAQGTFRTFSEPPDIGGDADRGDRGRAAECPERPLCVERGAVGDRGHTHQAVPLGGVRGRGDVHPHSGLEMDADGLRRVGDVADGQQVADAVEEDVRCCLATVGHRSYRPREG